MKTLNPGTFPRSDRGFTLIELMIVVVIVGVLAAIAIPNYSKHVRKGRRVDAKSAVLDVAARQEKYFATHNQYATDFDALKMGIGTSLYINGTTAGNSYYQLSLLPVGVAGYTVKAVPTSFGKQDIDECKGYQINQLGLQKNVAADGSFIDGAGCW